MLRRRCGRLLKVRFGALCGLKSSVAPGPKSARRRHSLLGRVTRGRAGCWAKQSFRKKLISPHTCIIAAVLSGAPSPQVAEGADLERPARVFLQVSGHSGRLSWKLRKIA